MPNPSWNGKSIYQRLLRKSDSEMSWLCLQGIPEEDDEKIERVSNRGWIRKAKNKPDRSKPTNMWGPTHSESSEEGEEKKTEVDAIKNFSTPPSKPAAGNNNSQDTASTKSSHEPATPNGLIESSGMQSTLGRVWDNLHCLEDTTANSTDGQGNENENKVMNLFESVFSPCKPKNLNETFSVKCEDTPLGIARLAPPDKSVEPSNIRSANASRALDGDVCDEKSTNTVESAAERRRQRHKRRQFGKNTSGPNGKETSRQEKYGVRSDQAKGLEKEHKNASKTTQRSLPVKSLELNCEQGVELERSISELTMRSSYGEATAKIAESRRMAYYAVGRHHRQSGRGGNRRCYFTGKLILGGAPFYAGSVQQGLRTLVVFCLPSAVGLPKEVQGYSSSSSRAPTIGSLGSGRRSNRYDGNVSVAHSLGVNGNSRSVAGTASLSRKNSKGSRLSSMDDATSLGCSVEEELDPNWELDKEYLLRVLPDPNQELLDEMAMRYPAQFETLPVQVRSPPCWHLYVKFCFFSGLPIAEGEMHYKVIDSIADRYGEEINLSHEVMEAVNGDSAEILRLPNLKTFRYLRKHYHQQSAKLPDTCFQRQAWEMVRPEV